MNRFPAGLVHLHHQLVREWRHLEWLRESLERLAPVPGAEIVRHTLLLAPRLIGLLVKETVVSVGFDLVQVFRSKKDNSTRRPS